MAGADYYSCDKCGCKTFYDADLQYGNFEPMQENPRTGRPMPDGNVGDMAVICKKCAEEYEVIIQAKNSK